MNCTIIQRRLLGTEDPAHPPDEVQAHLDGCTGCRDWQTLLLQMEQNVALLPVPASNSRAEFLQRLLHTPVATSVNGIGPHLKIRVPELVRRRAQSAGPRRLNTTLREWMPVVGAAAALLLIVFGWSEFVGSRQGVSQSAQHSQAAPDPLVAKLMEHHLNLVKANTAQGRMAALRDMDRALDQEMRTIAGNTDAQAVTVHLNRLRETIQKSPLGNEFTSSNSIVADSSKTIPATPVRIRQLRQNQDLVHRLVENSLELVKTPVDAPLDHAAHCEKLVANLAGEIAEAAQQHDGIRAKEMSVHLRDLLAQGVAANVNLFKEKSMPGGFTYQRQKDRIGEWTRNTTKELEVKLKGLDPHDMQFVIMMVSEGRDSVQHALKSEAA